MTKRNKYTIDYFIRKFTRTKPSEWCRYAFRNHKGQSCAMGLCGERYNRSTAASTKLCFLFNDHDLHAAYVNDNSRRGIWAKRFPKAAKAKTPRGRVLAALRQMQTMKAKGATAC